MAKEIVEIPTERLLPNPHPPPPPQAPDHHIAKGQHVQQQTHDTRPGQHVQIEILVHALVAVGRRRAQAAADDGTALNVDIQAVLGLLPQLVGLLGDLDIGALAVHLAVVGGIAGVLAPSWDRSWEAQEVGTSLPMVRDTAKLR